MQMQSSGLRYHSQTWARAPVALRLIKAQVKRDVNFIVFCVSFSDFFFFLLSFWLFPTKMER